MANYSCTFHFHAEQKGVTVTIGACRNHSQTVAGALALGPERVARAAEKRDVAVLQRQVQCLAIHETHHENISVLRVLNDGRKQTAHFVEIKFVDQWSPGKEKAR